MCRLLPHTYDQAGEPLDGNYFEALELTYYTHPSSTTCTPVYVYIDAAAFIWKMQNCVKLAPKSSKSN